MPGETGGSPEIPQPVQKIETPQGPAGPDIQKTPETFGRLPPQTLQPPIHSAEKVPSLKEAIEQVENPERPGISFSPQVKETEKQDSALGAGISEETLKWLRSLSGIDRVRAIESLPENQQPEAIEKALTIKGGAMGDFDPNEIIIANSSGREVGRHRVSEPEPTPRAPSQFEEVFERLEQLRIQNVPETDPRWAVERAERDRLLGEANSYGLYNLVKTELLSILYDANVRVTINEKEGKQEYRDRGGILDDLAAKQIIARQGSWEEATIQDLRTGQRRGDRLEFWSLPPSDPRIVDIVRRSGRTIDQLEAMFRGSIDYLYRESIDIIHDITENRRRYRNNEAFPNNGLYEVWNGVEGVVVDDRGRPLWDEQLEVEQRAANFDEVREAIDLERRKEPYLPARGDYERLIDFVADDEEELREMVPDIAKKVIRLLGRGGASALYENIEQEKRKIDRALGYFPFRSERMRRRVGSTLTDEINALAAQRLSRTARLDTTGYFHYADFLATATQDTEERDHLVDSLLLDEKGETMAALRLYSGGLPPDDLMPGGVADNELAENIKDGGFWRYGKNNWLTHKELDGEGNMGELLHRQKIMRNKFEDILAGIKLRPMTDLLNINNQGISQGNPSHPAFVRLKAGYDAEDARDLAQHGSILDDSDGPTADTRWEEYCRKALAWEKNGIFGDPRQRPRVLFQHPLARAFRPAGFEEKDAQGNVISTTTRDEFWDMFETDTKTENWYLKSKRNRLRQISGKEGRAEKILTSFQIDVTAGGPRHMFNIKEKNGVFSCPNGGNITLYDRLNRRPLELQLTSTDIKLPIKTHNITKDQNGNLSSTDGEIVLNEDGREALLLPSAVMLDINFDKNGDPFTSYVEDIVPHFVLIRALTQQALKEDEESIRDETDVNGKIVKKGRGEGRRRFKGYNILRNKLGIPVDMPMFAGWNEGAHDTMRPVLLQHYNSISGMRELFEAYTSRRLVKLVDGRPDRKDGMDEKGTVTGFEEFARRFRLVLEYVVKKSAAHYNFPGHGTPDGGGKEFRNANQPAYGISAGTVEMTSFIQELLSFSGDAASDLGLTERPIEQMVALYKGGNEVGFAKSGYTGYIENPRDLESWVKRNRGNHELMKLYNSGDKNKPGSFGVLNTGLISGVYHLRPLDYQDKYINSEEANFGLKEPIKAYNTMEEPTYEQYVDTAARVVAPFMDVLYQIYNSEDSNFGRNPESAKFAATMYWYSLSQWMDREWSEFRGIYGYAYNAVMPLARIFMHTVLKESALIYTDKQWDEIMLGYSRVESKDGKGKISVERVIRYKVDKDDNTIERIFEPKKQEKVEIDGDTIVVGATRRKPQDGETLVTSGNIITAVEVHEGVFDALPEDLKREIIRGQNTPGEPKWLHMGLDSYRPETLEIFKNFENLEPSDRTLAMNQVVAENLSKYTKPRRQVIR